MNTLAPIKIGKDWVQVLDDEGIVTIDRLTRLHYSYSNNEPQDNYNKVKDITLIKNYPNTKLWIRAISSEGFIATPNKLEAKNNQQNTNEATQGDNQDAKKQTK